MAINRKKTEAQIVVFSTRSSLYYGLAVFLGIFLGTVLISLFYFFQVGISAEIVLWILIPIAVLISGAFLIRLEYRIYLRSDFERRPPFLFIFYSMFVCAILFYIQFVHTPVKYLNAEILSIISIPVLSVALGFLLHMTVFSFFISILRVVDRFRQHTVLLHQDFILEMDKRIHEFKRYKSFFSLIILGIWVNDNYKDKLQKMLEYPLLLEIVRRNIRRGDLIGISKYGNRVLVLSNHNSGADASKHADRIISVLNHDPVLYQMIETASPEYLYVVEEGHEDSTAAVHFLEQVEKKLNEVLNQKDLQWRAEKKAK